MLQPIGWQAHHSNGLLQRHMGIPTAEDHTTVQGRCGSGNNQAHQIAEGSSTGQHTTSLIRQAKPGTEPGAELMFKAGEARGQLLSQKVVVESGTDQLRSHRSRQRGRIQVSQSTRVRRLKCTVHHHLQIPEQILHPSALA